MSDRQYLYKCREAILIVHSQSQMFYINEISLARDGSQLSNDNMYGSGQWKSKKHLFDLNSGVSCISLPFVFDSDKRTMMVKIDM